MSSQGLFSSGHIAKAEAITTKLQKAQQAAAASAQAAKTATAFAQIQLKAQFSEAQEAARETASKAKAGAGAGAQQSAQKAKATEAMFPAGPNNQNLNANDPISGLNAVSANSAVQGLVDSAQLPAINSQLQSAGQKAARNPGQGQGGGSGFLQALLSGGDSTTNVGDAVVNSIKETINPTQVPEGVDPNSQVVQTQTNRLGLGDFRLELGRMIANGIFKPFGIQPVATTFETRTVKTFTPAQVRKMKADADTAEALKRQNIKLEMLRFTTFTVLNKEAIASGVTEGSLFADVNKLIEAGDLSGAIDLRRKNATVSPEKDAEQATKLSAVRIAAEEQRKLSEIASITASEARTEASKKAGDLASRRLTIAEAVETRAQDAFDFKKTLRDRETALLDATIAATLAKANGTTTSFEESQLKIRRAKEAEALIKGSMRVKLGADLLENGDIVPSERLDKIQETYVDGNDATALTLFTNRYDTGSFIYSDDGKESIPTKGIAGFEGLVMAASNFQQVLNQDGSVNTAASLAKKDATLARGAEATKGMVSFETKPVIVFLDGKEEPFDVGNLTTAQIKNITKQGGRIREDMNPVFGSDPNSSLGKLHHGAFTANLINLTQKLENSPDEVRAADSTVTRILAIADADRAITHDPNAYAKARNLEVTDTDAPRHLRKGLLFQLFDKINEGTDTVSKEDFSILGSGPSKSPFIRKLRELAQ